VLFADLEGFTPFTERRDSEEVFGMLVAYFGRLAPLIRDGFGNQVPQFVGDQIFAGFNKAADQPDHAVRAAAAALALQSAAAEIATDHPEWPIFRVGVNSGEALVGSWASGATESMVSSETPSTSARGSKGRGPRAAS
jgi:class 3 adenylate cyclase